VFSPGVEYGPVEAEGLGLVEIAVEDEVARRLEQRHDLKPPDPRGDLPPADGGASAGRLVLGQGRLDERGRLAGLHAGVAPLLVPRAVWIRPVRGEGRKLVHGYADRGVVQRPMQRERRGEDPLGVYQVLHLEDAARTLGEVLEGGPGPPEDVPHQRAGLLEGPPPGQSAFVYPDVYPLAGPEDVHGSGYAESIQLRDDDLGGPYGEFPPVYSHVYVEEGRVRLYPRVVHVLPALHLSVEGRSRVEGPGPQLPGQSGYVVRRLDRERSPRLVVAGERLAVDGGPAAPREVEDLPLDRLPCVVHVCAGPRPLLGRGSRLRSAGRPRRPL